MIVTCNNREVEIQKVDGPQDDVFISRAVWTDTDEEVDSETYSCLEAEVDLYQLWFESQIEKADFNYKY